MRTLPQLARAATALVVFAFLAPARADVTILPLGDSITFGAHGNTAGYRYPLFVTLTQAGIGFRYIGQADTNCEPLPFPAQWHHDGFPGATIKDLRDNLDGNVKGTGMVVPNLGGYWMTGGKPDGDPIVPDVILLLAGTNNIIHQPAQGGTDVLGMEQQYTDLLGRLSKNMPNTVILVGTVLPITRQPASQNDQVVTFNTWLKANIGSFGTNCHLVDLYAAFLQDDGTPNAKLLGDGVHPTDAGYDIMARTWSDMILALTEQGVVSKQAITPAVPTYAFPTGKQSSIPGVNNSHVDPATAAAGATLTFSATITAGNNALTAPVVEFSLRDPKGNPLPGATSASVTLGNLAPHAEVTAQATLTVPAGLAPGAYDIAVDVKANEGTAHNGFTAKVTISP